MNNEEKRNLTLEEIHRTLHRDAIRDLILCSIVFVIFICVNVWIVGFAEMPIIPYWFFSVAITCNNIIAIPYYTYQIIIEFNIVTKRKYKIVSERLNSIGSTINKRKKGEFNPLSFYGYGDFLVEAHKARYHSVGDVFYLVIFEYAKKTRIALAFNAKYYRLDNNIE